MAGSLMLANLIAAAIAVVATGLGAAKGTPSTRPLWAAFAGLAAVNVAGCAALLATASPVAASGAWFAGVAVPEWLLTAAGAARSIRTHARVVEVTSTMEAMTNQLGCVTE